MLERGGAEADEPVGRGGAVLRDPLVDRRGVAAGEVGVGPVVVDRHGADELHVDPGAVAGGEPAGDVGEVGDQGPDLLTVDPRRGGAGGAALLGAGRAQRRLVGHEGLGGADQEVGVDVDDRAQRS